MFNGYKEVLLFANALWVTILKADSDIFQCSTLKIVLFEGKMEKNMSNQKSNRILFLSVLWSLNRRLKQNQIYCVILSYVLTA